MVRTVTSLLVALTSFQPIPEIPEGFADLLIGVGGCLAVPQGQSLADGTKVVVLAAAQPPHEIVVGTPAARGDRDAWRRTWRDQLPAGSSGQAVRVPAALDRAAVFAVAPRAGLRVLSGPRVTLSDRETARVLRLAANALPERWRSPDRVLHADRYGPASGNAAIELYVGRPVMNPRGSPGAPMRAVTIRRLFLVGGTVLASEEYERVSGREERAETEPPQLTLANWWNRETEHTVAYVSHDSGASWRRVSTDIGFEGINWIDQQLREGLPARRWFVYTPH
jgi:hypothetical protein